MKYDDLKWHINDEYPSDVPQENALIHSGMFMGWVLDNELESDMLRKNFSQEIQDFRNRKITGAKFLELCCDSKLTSDDLSKKANVFAEYYYATDDYIDDYVDISDDNNETIFHEPNTWEKYNQVYEIIQQRYLEYTNK